MDTAREEQALAAALQVIIPKAKEMLEEEMRTNPRRRAALEGRAEATGKTFDELAQVSEPNARFHAERSLGVIREHVAGRTGQDFIDVLRCLYDGFEERAKGNHLTQGACLQYHGIRTALQHLGVNLDPVQAGAAGAHKPSGKPPRIGWFR